ncbi:arsenate reductase (azurin) small subunit [Thiorhodococcus minor]|uniref:Arsenate reductase (Azurin) small subunit n=1 Tax=Thiorhodococcus minor TaxID=57489 RepID=A0A6M0K377_9GAMM|nr:arsenate reductase (azurin) small subunit [Thiorhodococcus minor]NEV62775.1 arsenate reductase (azurin) small subunit [Thiorhodococcus minor]
MKNLSRRRFLKASGAAATAGAALIGSGLANAQERAAPGATTLPYPREAITRAGALEDNVPVPFNYPDAESFCQIIKTGHPVPGGIGPDGDIVAFSTQCTHNGCPLSYDKEARTFKCGCHFSIFDPEMAGQMVDGQSTENLPRILLEHDTADDSLYAVAVEGLIYGRQCNLL